MRRGIDRRRAQRAARSGGKKGRFGRRRRLKGARGRGTLESEKPPIFGMIERGGEVCIKMLANVQQATIKPLIEATIVPGTCVFTDEYDIYSRLEQWGYEHESVCHSRGEYARDDDGDGFCEVHVKALIIGSATLNGLPDRAKRPKHSTNKAFDKSGVYSESPKVADAMIEAHVNTMEGFWSLLRSWLRPHRGLSQDKLPLYLGFFEFVHNVRRRGKALLGALLELLLR